MRTDFASTHLRCPACHGEHTLTLAAASSDANEVRDGSLSCSRCATTFPVARGVGELMVGQPEHVEREAAGLDRFADLMRADGWTRERVKRLPDIDDGYWFVQGVSMQQLLDTQQPKPGNWILDVGANTCWASKTFAQHGLRVIALDIATTEMQGLYTADYYIEDGVYFERVLGSMYDMPIASSSLDYVFCCEVLHHNDADSLRKTMREAFRVLRPGGKLFVVNETLKSIRDPVGVHVEGVEEFEGYEHAFWAAEYRWAATRAGFLTRLEQPRYHWFYYYDAAGAPPPWRRWKDRLLHIARRSPAGRQLFLAWLYHVRGDCQLTMVATKPRWARR